jgi:hypothetical protein
MKRLSGHETPDLIPMELSSQKLRETALFRTQDGLALVAKDTVWFVSDRELEPWISPDG